MLPRSAQPLDERLDTRPELTNVCRSSRKLTACQDALRATTSGWREVEGMAPGTGYRVGTLNEAPVVLELGAPSRLACSARHEQAVAAAAVERGWLSPGR